MALSAPSGLTNSSTTTPSDPHSTASISPTANVSGFIVGHHSRNPATTLTVAAGSGLSLGTITAIANVQYGTIASPTRRIYLWWYVGSASPGSGTVDFDFGASANGFAWAVLEVPGMDNSAPIAASNTNRADSATSLTITLDDVGGTLSWDGTLGFFSNGDSTLAMTVGSGFTSLYANTVASSNSFRTRGEYVLSKDTSVDVTQSSAHIGGIAVGILAAVAGGQPTAKRMGGVPGANLSVRLLGGSSW